MKFPRITNGQTMHTLPGTSQFPTTRWTLVVAAGAPHRKEARSALVSLCEGYWYPLYAYLRRRGYPADQAQDLTQEFFMTCSKGDISIALTRKKAGSGLSVDFLEVLCGRRRRPKSRSETWRRGSSAAGILVRRRTLPTRACTR